MAPTASRQTHLNALITGASGGIGLDLAHCLAEGGHNLILVARSADRLGQLAAEIQSRYHVGAVAVPIDLADPAAPDELYHLLDEQGLPVDVLVNNAGFGTHGPFDRADPAEQVQMLQLNVVALTHLTRLFLPPMLAMRRGRILNVASTAAFQAGPLMAVYYASKAYVLSFTEAIAAEVERSGVTVTALCPGPTDTGFQKRAGVENSPLFRANTMTSRDVARIGYRGLMRGQRLVIPGAKNKLLAWATRLGPRRLNAAIAKKLNATR
jgi:short-subunit dehydrogenase